MLHMIVEPTNLYGSQWNSTFIVEQHERERFVGFLLVMGYHKLPLVDLCNQRFMLFGVFAHNLSIDEEMIPYFGRHSYKMFIKGKPIRFGGVWLHLMYIFII